jgi:hypothetical protein
MGGGLFVKLFSKLVVSNSMISNCYAQRYGGAITLTDASPVIINNIICNNTAISIGGGMRIQNNSNPQIVNNTIVNNHCNSNSGGIDILSSTPVIKNCIVYGNTATYDPQIYPTGYKNVTNSDVEGGWTGKGNINADPKFISPTTGSGTGYKGYSADWGLSSGSPCMNGGAISLSNYSPILDFTGNIRVDYDTIDMGAHEYIQSDILCGTITASTTLSKYVIVTCDVTVNNGVTLTIPQGGKLRFMGSYKMNINGKLLAVGSYDKKIRFNAVFPDKPWKGIRFENTPATNDTSKIEYCIIENSYSTGAGTYDNYGGAILSVNVSKLIIRNNYLTNNRAQNYGGAIACVGASPYIVSNLIANNTVVSGNGGGIYLFNNSSNVINNTITRNSSSNTNGNGIYVNGGSPVFRNNIIWRNLYSGGININQLYPGIGLNVQYCDVEGGVYSGVGGVTTGNISIDPSFKSVSGGSGYSYNGSSPDWALQSTSTLINAGTPTTTGYNLPALDIEGRTRIHGTVDPGAFEDVSSINVCGRITKNTTWNASTVHVTCDVTVDNGITLTIAAGTKVVFDNFYCLRVKGRILAEGTANDTIRFQALNPAIGWHGIRYDSMPTYNNNDTSKFIFCKFENGKSKTTGPWTGIYGGAFLTLNYNKILIENSFFTNNINSVSCYGGAIAAYMASPTIRNCTFSRNSASGGGALFFAEFNGIFENCKITNNTAGSGGGIFITGYNTSKIANTLFANNTATNRGGGAYLYNDNPQIFINCTFSNNSAVSGGGIACLSNSDPVIKNSIFWSNYASSSGNEFYLDDVASDPKIYYSNIEGGTAAFGGLGSGANYANVYQNNIDQNPTFISPSTSDGNGAGVAYDGLFANWRLQQGSPCINSGTTGSTNPDIPGLDIDGNIRIFNGRVDMGVYENQQDILACGTITGNQTWEADTIKVTCDVNIANGATLNIAPGTYVQFQGPYKLEVSGRLLAVGTVNKMITFSVKDTNYFSEMDSFFRGGWRGIQFNSVASTNDSSKLVFCKISHGKASYNIWTYARGGAFYIYNTNKLLISNCIISNNRVSHSGAAMYLESSYPRILNNLICNNGATNSSSVTATGGAIFMNDASPEFINNTIVNNEGGDNGALMLFSGSSPIIKNCIFYNNISNRLLYITGFNTYGDIYLSGSSQPNIYNSIFTSNVTVDASAINIFQNVLYGNPSFINPSAGAGANYNGLTADWSLSSNTPCLNTGTPASGSLRLSGEDMGGNPRIMGDTIDMGAYEIQIHPRFLTSQPVAVTACVGTKASFSVSTSIPVAYQWQKSGVNIAGANGKTFNINSVTEADSGYYRCIMSNSNGNMVSDSAKLTVRTAPDITTHPNPTSSACIGSSTDFTVTASGSSPLTYQWYNLNGSVSGGSNPTYTINPVVSTSASTYYCTVTNNCGTATSNGATLTINTPVSVNPITSLNSICVGNTVSLSTLGSGTTPITYQWYKNGAAISGATNFTYQITNAQTSDAGSYYCKATNVCRSDSTNTSVLVVNTPPSITYQSPDDSVCVGQSKTFIISASSSLAISYQWYYGNTTNAISGATNNIYNINSVASTNSGTYYCKATNTCGTQTTNPITFTVKNPPSITSQSSNLTLCVGQQANFSVSATGTAPLTYAWYKDNNLIAGAVTNSYQISSVITSNAGNYYCVITNSCGSTSSSVKALIVNVTPTISSQSASDSVCLGQSKSFSVTANGSSPLTYQWYYNTTSNAISGATNNFYTINSVGASNGGAYYCKVSNTCGDATTSQINLTVKTAPSITSQSSNLVLCIGQQANFSVTVTGTAPITYTWYKDNVVIPGAVTSTYTITSVSSSDAGNYACFISNSCGTINSSSKILTVNSAPSIISQSLSDSVCSGQSKLFSVTVSGSTPMSYQWYYNSTSNAISGAVNNIYTINSVGTSNGGSYYCKATNSCGTVTTSQINLTVKTAPIITAQSTSAIRCVGQSQNFSVTATSSPAPRYQWFRDDVAITGATNNTYDISVVASSDAGNYYCLISNSCGNVQSSIKTLTVNTAPLITSQTPAMVKCAGQGATLDVKTSGTSPISYQWYHSGNILNGEINSFYTIYNIEPADSGSYYCVATNVCGNDQSGNILLSVNSPISIYKQSRDTSKCVGDATLFSVQVRGTMPVSYAWYFEEDTIDGAHHSSFYLDALQQSHTGNYFCKITNVCGSIDGAFKELIVRPLPVVHLGNDTTYCLGGSIDLSADGPYYCKWNNGSTKQSQNVKHSGTFFVYVTDPYGCSSYSDTIDVTVFEPYPFQDLCLVTVDPGTGKNLLAWERIKGQRIAYYNLYKETSQAGVYQKIGSSMFDSLSVFIDYNSNPRKKADRYAITVVDSCGNESDYSQFHKSIHLTANKGTSGENNLIWNHYEGFNFNTYKIYRGTRPYNMTLLDSIANNLSSYTDLKPPAGVAYYQVSAIKLDTCYPEITRAGTNNGPYSQSVSNLKDYSQLSTLYLSATPVESYINWKEGSTAIFDIYTNMSTWDASTSASWLTLVKDVTNSFLQAIASENYSAQPRVDTVRIFGDGVAPQDVVVNQDGTTGILEITPDIHLMVYPNPFNYSTNIEYELRNDANVRIEVYNMVGARVALVTDEHQIPGKYNFTFDDASTDGIYILRIVVNNNTITRKLIKTE